VTSPRTTLPYAIVAVFALALALPRPAAAQKMDVRLGLWEMSTTVQMSGEPPVDTSKMTPEQRAQMEAALAATKGIMARPHTIKSCLTKEKLSKGFLQEKQESCKHTVLTDTSTELGVSFVCTANDGETTTGEWHFQAISRESVKGTGKMTMSKGGQSMTGASSMTAKWVGDACGNVK
jgi:hypothetical protein